MKREKIFNPIINEHSCFECGGLVEEMHHVVPYVRGGTRVIPLCESCHGKVHNLDRMGHSQLIREGLERVKALGKRTGCPPYGFSAGDKGMLIINRKEQKTIKFMLSLRDQEYTLREIQDSLNEEQMFNRMGRPFNLASVHGIITKNTKE